MSTVGEETEEDWAISDEESLAKVIEKNGVLVIAFDTTEPLPESLAEWLKDPVKYDREMRMRELLKGAGLEDLCWDDSDS